MSILLSGIGGLKKINSLLRAKSKSAPSMIEKDKKVSALKGSSLTQKTESITTGNLRLDSNICITADKNREIQNLIHKRLLCEESIRLKHEIKNFSSIIFYGLV